MDFRASQPEADLDEFRELVRSAGVSALAVVAGSRTAPDPRYFVGSGKVEEIKALAASLGADAVLFNHDLSPAQGRNLEQAIGRRVIDRTGVILDIFAQRAQTFEGKLQVELAQLQHLSTRLVRGWTHLERQKGGIGLRGPGETQLETDRRLVAQRIRQIHQRLERVRAQRGQGRRARRRAALPVVSLIGYTNAGKSTLFNRLTGADVLAADQLFATLDPTLRRVELPGLGPVLMSDTVGFIRQLPHDLVAAFRATLEEVCEADLLLHVVDAADVERDAKIAQTLSVLELIGAAQVPVVEVCNKIDLMPHPLARMERDADGSVRRVWLSARDGAGLALLGTAVAERLSGNHVELRLALPFAAARLRARLFAAGVVLGEEVDAACGNMVSVRALRLRLEGLCRSEGYELEALVCASAPAAEWHDRRAAGGG